MKVAIAGAGNVGRYVAADLVARGHDVILIDNDGDLVARHSSKIDCTWVNGDACEPLNLQGAGLDTCNVLVAATGDDKVNLVASLLAKQEFGIPRVLARVNHPKNEWLFNESWGVDVPVSPPHLLTSLVEEAVTVDDLVTLLRLEQGKVAVIEFTLGEGSPAVGKVVSELQLPRDCALVAIVRSDHVLIPRDEVPLMAGDHVLGIATPEGQAAFEELLSGTPGGSDARVG